MSELLPSDWGWHLTTFVYAWLSGVVPVLNCEVYLLWLVVAAPADELWRLVLTATAGQMLAKALLYWTGRGLVRLPAGRCRWLPRPLARTAVEAALGRERRWLRALRRGALVTASAFAGVPPFYAFSAACGALRWSFGAFLLCGTAGRLARFSAIMLLPPGLASRLPGPGTLALLLGLALLVPPLARLWRRGARATALVTPAAEAVLPPAC